MEVQKSQTCLSERNNNLKAKKMKKNFTHKQVMNGEVDYSFEDFLLDLFHEVESLISKDDSHKTSGEVQASEYKRTINEVFRFVSEICFQAAINSPDLKLLLEKTKGEEKEIIKETLKSNKDNIALLRAILRRQLASGLEKGLTKRQAAKQGITQNKGKLIRCLGKSARKFPK